MVYGILREEHQRQRVNSATCRLRWKSREPPDRWNPTLSADGRGFAPASFWNVSVHVDALGSPHTITQSLSRRTSSFVVNWKLAARLCPQNRSWGAGKGCSWCLSSAAPLTDGPGDLAVCPEFLSSATALFRLKFFMRDGRKAQNSWSPASD